MGQAWLVTLGFGLHPPFHESTFCAVSCEITSLAWKNLENCETCSLVGASPLGPMAGGEMGTACEPCALMAAQISL